jgi:hypothetical protein
MSERYEIAKEFSAGFAAALIPSGIDPAKPSHWHAGYSAGYGLRTEKNRLLNEYLVSIGEKPLGIVRIV